MTGSTTKAENNEYGDYKNEEMSLEEDDLEDYLSDTSLDLKPDYPEFNDSLGTVVVVTNLPKVPEAKVAKLSNFLLKLVSRIGNLATLPEKDYIGMLMPCDSESGSTNGFAFVEYETVEEAKKAIEVLANYKFDKNHLLNVFPYDDMIRLNNIPDSEFTVPEPAPFVPRPVTSTWLLDDSQRDEFVIRQGRETVVYWYDGGKLSPTIDYDGHREKAAGVVWCEYYVSYSPKGSCLATLVPNKGVIVWGGPKYEKLNRFPAQGVQFVLFSPQESFMLTCNNRKEDHNAIKIFDVHTGKLLRCFSLYPDNCDTSVPPPPFQWSHDDNYIARMGKDLISIYETPSFKLLERRSLSASGILEFQWSPKANILAYWAPEMKNIPAHVDLIEIPSRKALRQKNLFNVTSCSIVWQDEGEYLGVKVTRHTKSKKTHYNNIELFRMKESGIPVEMLDIKDAVMAFAWEPRGSRFAMIHAESPNSTKVNVSIYDMMRQKVVQGKKKQVLELHKIETLQNKQCNCLFWSPAGGVILLAGLGDSSSGILEFYDLQDKTLIMKEHYRANNVFWDPSGRSVATVVSQPIEGGHFKYAMDNGYILWSFQGKQLYQASFEHFYQFQWRPREKNFHETRNPTKRSQKPQKIRKTI